ncbi:MAG: DUF4845 domain-containing protein [Betaproteobacteria bacterium]|jgi:hypothetical protein
MRTQRGLSLIGLLFVSAVLFFVAVLGMKVFPVCMEYVAVRKGVMEIMRANDGGSEQEIRASFDKRATIDDITSVQGKDLEIMKNGDSFIVLVEYSKKIPLFGPVSLCFDFSFQHGR